MGAHGRDEAEEEDDHITAAGTISYSNDPENNSDDTALSVSDEAAVSSDDDLMRNRDSNGHLSPTSAQVEADMMRQAPALPAARKANAAPRMGGPSSGNGAGGSHESPAAQWNLPFRRSSSRDKLHFAAHTGTSTPPTSFGQLLCSLPEAKPVTQFPLVMDQSSSPPSSSRKWPSLHMPPFPDKMHPEDGWDGDSDGEEEFAAAGSELELHTHGPAPPSSTDSLIQGQPSGAYARRGAPDGMRLDPQKDVRLQDVSPWPSMESSAALGAWNAGWPAAPDAGGAAHGDARHLLPEVSTASSLASGGAAEANTHGTMPPPALKPLAMSGLADVSPWPSTGSLAHSYASSSRQHPQAPPPQASLGAVRGAGVAGELEGGGGGERGVMMAPMSASGVEMSPFPSAQSLKGGGGGFGRGGCWGGGGGYGGGGGGNAGRGGVGPISGAHVNMSPFPSSSALKGGGGVGRWGGAGAEAASVLRQAADALKTSLPREGEPPSPGVIYKAHGRTDLLPSPHMHINMLPSPPSYMLDDSMGNGNHELADEVAPSTGGALPVSGIILSPWSGQEQGASSSHSATRVTAASAKSPLPASDAGGGGGGGTGGHAAHVQTPSSHAAFLGNSFHEAGPPVSGIIFSPAPAPAPSAAAHPRQGGTATKVKGGESEEPANREGRIKGLVSRIARGGGGVGVGVGVAADGGLQADAWSALRDLQRLVHASSSSSAAAAKGDGAARTYTSSEAAGAAVRHEVCV